MSTNKYSSFCHVVDHPILKHLLTELRNETTRPSAFRRKMNQISNLMAYECTRNLETKEVSITTPMEKMQGYEISNEPVVVSILRAGNGMLDGFLNVLPFASVGHVGIYRDKFINNTVEYYFRVPSDLENKKVLLLDPILATGDTVVAAINRLKEYESGPIHFVCILSSPQGLEKLHEFHPDVKVVTLSIERELNDKGYLLPGIGDAGDRLYGTEV